MPRCMALLQRRHERIGIVGGDGDGIDLLGDQRVDDLDLAFGRGRGRAGIDHLDIAEFLRGFLRAFVGGIEEAVAERFDDEGDPHRVGVRSAEAEQRPSATATPVAAISLRIIAFPPN